MKQISTRYALLSTLFALIVCTMLYSPMIEAQQKMYWTNFSASKIQRADLDGNNVEDLITTGLSRPYGIALDLANSKMYWTDFGTDKIQRADLDGNNVEDLVTTVHSTGIALDLTNHKMYWLHHNTPKIQRADLDGSNVEDLVTTGLSILHGIALDLTNGKMYWIDDGTNKIQRADLDGNNVEDLVTTGLDSPFGIALDLANSKMYWTDLGTDKIQRADLDGNNVEDLITTGLSSPLGIALDLTNGKMYWLNNDTHKIQRADLDGQNVEDLVTTDHTRFIALDLSPPPFTIDITAVPNPATPGGPLDILLDLSHQGIGFNAEFRLWALANGNVTTLVSLSPFIPNGLFLTGVNVFSTASVPAGLPPTVGFLAAVFDASNGELRTFDFESVGIGVAPSAADINALRQTATDFLDSGAINAAPPPPTQELNFNGRVNNPFEQQVSAKEKLTTTWGRIKSQR